MKVIKLGPIINAEKFPNSSIDLSNIGFPFVMHTPSWLESLYGRYMMYFSHHKGRGLRITTANNLMGPWTPPIEILPVSEFGHDHVASPDCLIDEENEKITMFYHTGHEDRSPQRTYSVETNDGLTFSNRKGPHGWFYWRNTKDGSYAVAKYKNESGIIYARREGDKYEELTKILPNMRHCCLDDGHIYFSRIGDAPERILRWKIDINEKPPYEEVCKPDHQFENLHIPIAPSRPGSAEGVQQLRDPFVFNTDGIKYLLYSYGGEEGLALAVIEE